MLTNGHTEARKLRSRLNHPIIDADGHWAEFQPLMREEFRKIGGATAVEALAMASARIPKYGWQTGEAFSAELWLLNDSTETKARARNPCPPDRAIARSCGLFPDPGFSSLYASGVSARTHWQ
jgi:hypothetical protein